MIIGTYIGALTLSSFWTFIAWRNAVDYGIMKLQVDRKSDFNSYWSLKNKTERWDRQYRFATKVLVGLLLAGVGVGIFSLVAL